MKIALASDHGGYHLKESLKTYLSSKGYDIEDFGAYSDESVDYPDYAVKAATAVVNGVCEKGILICSTGIGISISANKIKGIRCALCSDLLSARLTREHNDTNMLAMGAFIVGEKLAYAIAEEWLSTPFSNEERHSRRIRKIAELENDAIK